MSMKRLNVLCVVSIGMALAVLSLSEYVFAKDAVLMKHDQTCTEKYCTQLSMNKVHWLGISAIAWAAGHDVRVDAGRTRMALHFKDRGTQQAFFEYYHVQASKFSDKELEGLDLAYSERSAVR